MIALRSRFFMFRSNAINVWNHNINKIIFKNRTSYETFEVVINFVFAIIWTSTSIRKFWLAMGDNVYYKHVSIEQYSDQCRNVMHCLFILKSKFIILGYNQVKWFSFVLILNPQNPVSKLRIKSGHWFSMSIFYSFMESSEMKPHSNLTESYVKVMCYSF